MKRRTFLALLPALSAGCLKDFTTVARPQLSEPDPATKVQIIGDVAAEFDNATDMVVSGYGLVTGLDGNGGSTPPCDARTAVIERLKRAKYENPAEVIDSPDCAIVIVNAVVKPGVRRDEMLDVEVSLPEGSKVKSLRGGILQPTGLVTFASQGDVRDYLKQKEYGTISEGNRMLRGHEVMIARGLIQAALVKDEEEAATSEPRLKRGYVWKGGKMLEGRPLYLVLKTDEQRYRTADQVATRLNETFHGGETASTQVAHALHKDLVAVAVPPRYRLNRPHYMRVVWAIPFSAPNDAAAYIREWEDKLQVPETTLPAAIRLEALGAPGAPALKAALRSDYPLVRFAAAEALAYQGQTSGAETLAKIAAEHPALQAYALTALAALDDALGMTKLEELLGADSPELRYGAFRALREINPNGDLIRGEWAERSFMIHRVPTAGKPLVHLLRQGRAEVVLFSGKGVKPASSALKSIDAARDLSESTPAKSPENEDIVADEPKLVPPFALTAGSNLTVTARKGDTVATVSRFSARSSGEATHAQCPLRVTDVLKQMAELGASYSDVAEMLRKADERKALSCELAFDALPKAVPIKRLAEAARLNPGLQNEAELLKETDEASTPGLFTPPTETTTRQ
jgi:flagellar basal body P-ring protein FlgI